MLFYSSLIRLLFFWINYLSWHTAQPAQAQEAAGEHGQRQQFTPRLAKSCCLTATVSQHTSLNLPQHILTHTLTQLAKSTASFREIQTRTPHQLQRPAQTDFIYASVCEIWNKARAAQAPKKSEHMWDKQLADKLQQPKNSRKDGGLFLFKRILLLFLLSRNSYT